MIHPADKRAQNPRIQCDVCGKWSRLHTDKGQRFFGGCAIGVAASNNGDHNAAGASQDVCNECCKAECKPSLCAGCDVRQPWEHRCCGSGCPCVDCRSVEAMFNADPAGGQK